MEINSTSSNFITQLKEKYQDTIILGKKSTKDVITSLSSIYNLIPIRKVEDLDYIGQIKTKELSSILNNSKNMFETNYTFDFYLVESNISTAKYYKYYHERFVGELSIYIYHETKTNRLFSNCELLELQFTILQGVEESDVRNSTKVYIDYLNTCYLYDWSCECGAN